MSKVICVLCGARVRQRNDGSLAKHRVTAENWCSASGRCQKGSEVGTIGRRALAKRASVRRYRPTKTQEQIEFWEFVACLPCFVCVARKLYRPLLLAGREGIRYMATLSTVSDENGIEIAHLGRSTSHRGIGQKYPWQEVGPLCAEHHRLHHAGTKSFWTRPGVVDRDQLIDFLWAVFRERKNV